MKRAERVHVCLEGRIRAHRECVDVSGQEFRDSLEGIGQVPRPGRWRLARHGTPFTARLGLPPRPWYA